MIKHIAYLIVTVSSTIFASNNDTEGLEYQYGLETMVARKCCLLDSTSDKYQGLETTNLLSYLTKLKSKYRKKLKTEDDEYQLFLNYVNEIKNAPKDYYKYLSDVRVSPNKYERTNLFKRFNCITTDEELKKIKDGYTNHWKEWFPSNYLKYIKKGGSSCKEWFEPNSEYKKMIIDLENLKSLADDSIKNKKDFNLVLNMYYTLIKSKYAIDYNLSANSIDIFEDINNSCNLAISINKEKSNMNFIDFVKNIEGGDSVIQNKKYGNIVAFSWEIYSNNISCEVM